MYIHTNVCIDGFQVPNCMGGVNSVFGKFAYPIPFITPHLKSLSPPRILLKSTPSLFIQDCPTISF